MNSLFGTLTRNTGNAEIGGVKAKKTETEKNRETHWRKNNDGSVPQIIEVL